MNPHAFLAAALAAVGLLNILLSIADGVASILERAFLFSRRRVRVPRPERREKPFDPYGLDDVPWDGLRVGAALIGALLAALLFWERSPYLSALGLALGYVPSLVRAYLLRRRMAQIDGRVRHLVLALGSALRAYGGLAPALRAVVTFLAEDNPVGARMAFHLNAGKSGREVLEALATDLRSSRLADLARCLADAEVGVRTPERILQETLEAMRRDSLVRSREAIGAAPLRLQIPMLFLLVPPILVLALYPPVARLLALISSTGGSAIGW